MITFNTSFEAHKYFEQKIPFAFHLLSEPNKDGEYQPVIVFKNVSGYFLLDYTLGKNKEFAQRVIDMQNECRDVSKIQTAEILTSSMF